MNFLTNVPWNEIVWPCASLALVVGFIIVLRWFGKFENSSEAVGSDLNLTTFGFAADLLVQLMEGHKILPRWTLHLSVLALVAGLLFGNLMLYMCNLRLAKSIEECMTAKKWFVTKCLKLVSVFIGIVSAVMFVVAEGYWG